MMLKSLYSNLVTKFEALREKIKPGLEFEKATRFWSGLESYHLSNDSDIIAISRSRWIATEIVPMINPTTFIEVGCNSGRNLKYLRETYPSMIIKGLDVNALAIEYARSTKPGIEFELVDVNHWAETENSWDCALTMSVIDHIPEEASRILAKNIASSCGAVIGVELWDGSYGERALYKYSNNLKEIYEAAGFVTLRWEPVPQNLQYDISKSTLWIYVGSKNQESGL